jgi:hypothetical protein
VWPGLRIAHTLETARSKVSLDGVFIANTRPTTPAVGQSCAFAREGLLLPKTKRADPLGLALTICRETLRLTCK